MDVSSSFLLQKQVRENTQDLESFMLDLKNWEDGMKKKEQNICGSSNKESDCQQKKAITKDDVDYVKSVFEDGMKQVKKGKLDLAVKSFSNAIRKYNKNPVFYLKRAKCYLKLKKAKEAEADCSAALALDPKLLKAKFIRSQARELMGHYRGACLDLQDILILDPPNETAKAALDHLTPKYKEFLAKTGFQKFDEPEEDSEPVNDILEVLARNENIPEDTELEDKKQRAEEDKKRGNAYVKAGNWEEAKKAYSRAILNYPNDPIYYANRAWCYLNGDKKDERRAILDCNVALQKNPSYGKVYMRRAVAKKAIGNLWGARSDIKQLLQLEPNNLQAKKDLEEINLLIEDKLYKNYQYHETESSSSDEEKYQPLNNSNDQYFSAEELDHIPEISKSPLKKTEGSSDEKQEEVEINSHQITGKKGFTYVFPVNKPVNKRSKKPLKRVSIKFLDNEMLPLPTDSKNNEDKFPEWMNNPKSISMEVDTQVPLETTPPIDKKNEFNSKHPRLVENIKGENNFLGENELLGGSHNDFKYVFPIFKKPHERSKKPLKRIPVKFA